MLLSCCLRLDDRRRCIVLDGDRLSLVPTRLQLRSTLPSKLDRMTAPPSIPRVLALQEPLN